MSTTPKKTATVDQVRKNFLVITDKKEARRSIWDGIDSTWNEDNASELAIAIMKDLEETVKAEGGNIGDWDIVDRITWAVKQAYNLGFCRGWAVTAEANEMAFIDLFGADALGFAPGGFDVE